MGHRWRSDLKPSEVTDEQVFVNRGMVVTGKMPVAIPMQFGYVDVRDVATAHILAMQNTSSNGERFALSEKDLSYKEIAKLLKENGFKKAPSVSVPVWLAKFLANFNRHDNTKSCDYLYNQYYYFLNH